MTPEKIPPLINIAPGIFVPFREDLFEAEPPRDRVERLKRLLTSIDYQREGVKENLVYMFEREKRRLVLQAAEMEQALPPPKVAPGALPPNEVDQIIANMEAPAKPGMDYNIRDMSQIDLSVAIPPDASLRDRTVIELLYMVERALWDLRGYEGHMRSIREAYVRRLEQELANVEEAGKRPEERLGAKGY